MSRKPKDNFVFTQVRPRFQLESPDSIIELTEKIKIGLSKENAICKGWISDNYGTLFLPVEEQHYWSPYLNLNLEPTEKGTLINGLYGPRPSVWTMFVFFYALIFFIIFVIGIIGLSNILLHKSVLILWWIPVLIVVFLSLYLVAFFGQKLGHNQMVILHQFMEETTGLTFE